ncbi:MAG: ATP-binding protein [Saprospiraceae bacterium]
MEQISFIGREQEQLTLKKALHSNEAEMVAVIGRRRVGKTFLIKNTFSEVIAFQMSGIQNATLERQLENFAYRLSLLKEQEEKLPTPKNWFTAFTQLIDFLRVQKNDKKYVVFFDELPWLAGRKSDFIQGLSFFWNSWAVDQPIVVVICGSAASWMVQKVVNDTGGLHNRITRLIKLQPFTLAETEAYFESRNIPLNRYHIIQIYMVLGGIPHYLKEVEAGKSATQNINDICFSDGGLLQNEFANLYPALFNNADNHISIIRALATKTKGMLRSEISRVSGVKNGGTLTKTLDELELSGFITSYYAWGKKSKGKLFRLTDEYSQFYLYFIEKNRMEGDDTWQYISQTQTYKSWSGYAFESICIKHLPQIKRALQIGGINALSSTFYKKGTSTDKGVQIDLILDRKDQVINLFEIKFYNKEFVLSKAYAEMLRRKMNVFQSETKTNKLLLWIIIAPFGMKQNQHSLDLVYNVLDLDALF